MNELLSKFVVAHNTYLRMYQLIKVSFVLLLKKDVIALGHKFFHHISEVTRYICRFNVMLARF